MKLERQFRRRRAKRLTLPQERRARFTQAQALLILLGVSAVIAGAIWALAWAIGGAA